MALFHLLISVSSLALFLSVSSAASDFFATSCKFSHDPKLCLDSLAPFKHTIQNNPAETVKIFITIAEAKAQKMATHLTNLSHQVHNSKPAAHPNLIVAVDNCLDVYNTTVYGLHSSTKDVSDLASYKKGEDLDQLLDSLDMTFHNFLDDEEQCNDLWEPVPDGPIKTDFLRYVRNLKVADSSYITYHLFTDFTQLLRN